MSAERLAVLRIRGAPGIAQQGVVRQHPTAVSNHGAEQLVLGRRQPYFLAVSVHNASCHVDAHLTAHDHRLRVRIASDIAKPRVVADAMFGPVERVQIEVPEAEAKVELPLPTAPLHRPSRSIAHPSKQVLKRTCEILGSVLKLCCWE